MDYTLKKYAQLCQSLVNSNYRSIAVRDCIKVGLQETNMPTVVLRHDVDRLPITALQMAKVENQYGLVASYYFRIPSSFDDSIISQIALLGHEIGLHYEVLDKAKGNIELARDLLERDLREMRAIEEVVTVSMHGNPSTNYDNRDIWEHFSFEQFQLIGEVYLSMPFDQLYYYSDTGRNWAGKYNLKDHIPSGLAQIEDKPLLQTTDNLINFIRSDNKDLYLLTHPERWPHTFLGWLFSATKDYLLNFVKLIFRLFYRS